MKTPVRDRLLARTRINEESGCWEWQGCVGLDGYGRINMGGKGGKILCTHRVSWELHNGPIYNNLFVLHHCDNKKCINPNHLFLGTQRDNVNDKVKKGRQLVGCNNPISKLNQEQVREIRVMLKYMTQSKIASIYGVHQSVISDLRTGKSYRDVK